MHAPEKVPAGALSKLLLAPLCPGFWESQQCLGAMLSVTFLLLPLSVS